MYLLWQPDSEAQISTQTFYCPVNLQSQVFLIKYSNGEGTTNQYLNYQENIDRLDFDLLQATNDYRQNLSKLLLLVE